MCDTDKDIIYVPYSIKEYEQKCNKIKLQNEVVIKNINNMFEKALCGKITEQVNYSNNKEINLRKVQ